MQLKHRFSDRTTVAQMKGLYIYRKIAADFVGTKARFPIRAKICRTNKYGACASCVEESKRPGRLGGGELERERKDKETTYCSRSSKNCLEKEVCLSSWQPRAPWLGFGNSPGVSAAIPSGFSSLASYGNVKAKRGRSHPTPTSAGGKQGRIFLLCSISTWLGS